MTLEEFEDLVDANGPDSVTWPADRRAEALALLVASPEARSVLDESRQLSAAFASAPAIRAPAGLAARITLAAATSTATASKASAPEVSPFLHPAAHGRRVRPGAQATRPVRFRARESRRAFSASLIGAVRSGLALPLCFAAGLVAALVMSQSNAAEYWSDRPAAFALAN